MTVTRLGLHQLNVLTVKEAMSVHVTNTLDIVYLQMAQLVKVCTHSTSLVRLSKSILLSDVDECREANPCSDVCVNTPGSYYCSCSEGFVLDSDDEVTCHGLYLHY